MRCVSPYRRHSRHLEALAAVFEDIDRQQPDHGVSLGDNIGCGPDPVGVMRLLRSRRVFSLPGNHEWAMADPRRAEGFNRKAREALLWTIAAMPADLVTGFAGCRHPWSFAAVAWCMALARGLLDACRRPWSFAAVVWWHGPPPDNIVTYLHGASDKVVRKAFAKTAERLTFVGHGHMLEGAELAGPAIRRFAVPPGRHHLQRRGASSSTSAP